MTGRPRLLVLASTYPRWSGDPEPGFVHELARRLVARFDVSVIAPHAAGAATRETMDGVDVRRYHYAPARWATLVHGGGIVANLRRARWKWLLLPGFFLSMAWALVRALRESAPAVVHVHWLIPQGLVAGLLLQRTPWLVTSHGADLFALRGGIFRALKRFVLSRASATSVVSAAMRDELRQLGVDPSRIAVEPMGVDLDGLFVPDNGIPRSRDGLLFVGRLVEKKGVRHLVEAMPRVLEARPGVTLDIAGFGPEAAQLQSLVEKLGLQSCVRFLGAQTQAQLVDRYRRAALFVAPFVQAASGDQEGLGLVAIEAAGCGCPLVLGAVPAARDVLHGLDIGEFVDATDIAALASVIVRALQEPRVVSEDALATLRARFGWTARAHAYGDLLASLAGPRA